MKITTPDRLQSPYGLRRAVARSGDFGQFWRTMRKLANKAWYGPKLHTPSKFYNEILIGELNRE